MFTLGIYIFINFKLILSLTSILQASFSMFWPEVGGAPVWRRCRVSYVTGSLILVYSWARPILVVAGKGRGGIFLFLLCFFTLIPVPLSPLSLYFISSSISFLSFSGRRQKMTHKG